MSPTISSRRHPAPTSLAMIGTLLSLSCSILLPQQAQGFAQTTLLSTADRIRTAATLYVSSFQPSQRSAPFALQATASPTKKSSIGHVETLETHQDLLSAMNNDSDDLLVVKYYASYCKLCQRAGVHYKQLATKFEPPSGKNVWFARFEGSQLSAAQLRSLGVTKFPFVQVYRRGDCVASFSAGSIGPAFRKNVQETVELCLNRSEQEWSDFLNEFQSEVQENHEARRALQSQPLPAKKESKLRGVSEQPAFVASAPMPAFSHA